MSGRHDPAMLRQAQQPGFVLTPPNPNPGWTISRLRSTHRISTSLDASHPRSDHFFYGL